MATIKFSIEDFPAILGKVSNKKYDEIIWKDLIEPDGDTSGLDSLLGLFYLLSGKEFQDIYDENDNIVFPFNDVVGTAKFEDGFAVTFYGPQLMRTPDNQLFIRSGNNDFLIDPPKTDPKQARFCFNSEEREREDGTKFQSNFLEVYDPKIGSLYRIEIKWDWSLVADVPKKDRAKHFFHEKFPVKQQLTDWMLEGNPELFEYIQPSEMGVFAPAYAETIQCSELPLGIYEIVEFIKIDYTDKDNGEEKHFFKQVLKGFENHVIVEGKQREQVRAKNYQNFNAGIANGNPMYLVVYAEYEKTKGKNAGKRGVKARMVFGLDAAKSTGLPMFGASEKMISPANDLPF